MHACVVWCDVEQKTSCSFLSPSSCRDSAWSALQSCKVATLSIVSPVTSWKWVSSSLQRKERIQWVYLIIWVVQIDQIKCFYAEYIHNILYKYSIWKPLIHLSIRLQGPKGHPVGTRWERPKRSWQIVQGVCQSAVHIDVEARRTTL